MKCFYDENYFISDEAAKLCGITLYNLVKQICFRKAESVAVNK